MGLGFANVLKDFEHEQTEKTESLPNFRFLCYLLLIRRSNIFTTRKEIERL